MTAAEYLAIGATAERYELIDGVIIMSPSPRPRHQSVASFLASLAWQEGRPGDAPWVFPETDLTLSAALVYRPDICLYTARRFSGVPARLDTPPDLVIEVLSPSTRLQDLNTKRDDYERFGVREYWAVDAETGGVSCWRLEAGRFVAVHATGEFLVSTAVNGYSVDLGRLRGLCGPV